MRVFLTLLILILSITQTLADRSGVKPNGETNRFWADGNYEVDGDNLTMDGDTHNITKLNSSSAEVELCCPVVTGPVDLALEDGSIVFDYTSINSNVVQGFERLPKSNSNNKVDENKPTITMNEMRAIMAKKLMESK